MRKPAVSESRIVAGAVAAVARWRNPQIASAARLLVWKAISSSPTTYAAIQERYAILVECPRELQKRHSAAGHPDKRREGIHLSAWHSSRPSASSLYPQLFQVLVKVQLLQEDWQVQVALQRLELVSCSTHPG